MSCLYILEINPLSVVLFANIFSHSEGCIFVLFMVSFAVQKLLSFIRFNLFIFVFISISLGGGSKKDLAVIYLTQNFEGLYFPLAAALVSSLAHSVFPIIFILLINSASQMQDL